jgi:hypothetical protein
METKKKATSRQLNKKGILGWISENNLRPTLEICALHPSFSIKFSLIWHLTIAPCAQLFALSARFLVRSMFYALRPTFMKFTPAQGLG